VTSTSGNDRVNCSASGLPSDTVLLQLIAPRHQTSSPENMSAPTDNSGSTVNRRQLANNSTKATTPRYDGKTATVNRMPATIRHKLRQKHSSTHVYSDISAAISRSRFSPTKHFQPMPSPVDSYSTSVTEISGYDSERDQASPVQRTCLDDDTCPPATTSHRRLPATTNEMHMQTSTKASPAKSRSSKTAIIADMGFTPQQFMWLQDVNRCLNPHRRYHW